MTKPSERLKKLVPPNIRGAANTEAGRPLWAIVLAVAQVLDQDHEDLVARIERLEMNAAESKEKKR
jgi:hypothetical protein